MKKRAKIIDLLNNVRYTTCDIKKMTDKIISTIEKHDKSAVNGVKNVRTKEDLLDILPIGIELIPNDKASESDGYYKARNNGTVIYNEDYSEFPESKGKVIIYFNINYSRSGIFACIEQDGGTRTVYNGIIHSRSFFISLLNNIR